MNQRDARRLCWRCAALHAASLRCWIRWAARCPRPLLLSYSGSMGGAERVLIDFASGLERPAVAGVPGGTAGRCRARRGPRVWPLPARSTALRADRFGALRRLAAHRREVRALVRDLEPELVVANGMRSALALLWPRPPRDAPSIVFLQHDLLPGPLIGALVRSPHAARRSSSSHPGRSRTTSGRRVQAVRCAPGRRARALRPRSTAGGAPGGAGARRAGRLEAATTSRSTCSRTCAGDRPDVRLRIVGAPIDPDGRAAARCACASARRGPTWRAPSTSPGAVADPAGELARASCLLHCAPREPFGLVVVEALAAGRPVVAPASAGPPEILGDGRGTPVPARGRGRRRRAPLLRDPERAGSARRLARARIRAVRPRCGPRAVRVARGAADRTAATPAAGAARAGDGHAQLRLRARRAAAIGRAPPPRGARDRRRQRVDRRHAGGRARGSQRDRRRARLEPSGSAPAATPACARCSSRSRR